MRSTQIKATVVDSASLSLNHELVVVPYYSRVEMLCNPNHSLVFGFEQHLEPLTGFSRPLSPDNGLVDRIPPAAGTV